MCTLQGESSDVFSLHRLKAAIALESVDLRLTAPNLAQTFYQTASVEYVEGAELLTLAGDPSAFAGAAHSVSGNELRDEWDLHGNHWTLTTTIDRMVARNTSPVLTVADFS